jgi:hypothetical protein
MRPSFIIRYFLPFVILAGCNNPNDISDEWESSLPIEPTELHAKQGDCFAFQDSLNRYFIGTIMNFHKSKDGIRYAMCFNNYYDSTFANNTSCDSLRFCGRKVMYSTPEQYTIGFDITWVRDSVIDNHKTHFVCNIDLTPVKSIDISAEVTAINFKDFCNYFHSSRNDRQIPPDNYWDMTKEHLRTDEYFTVKQISDWYKNFIPK